MSLRLRFLLSLLAVLALMTLPALHAVDQVHSLRDIVVELRGEAAQSALAAARLQAALGQLDRYQRAYLAEGDPEMAAQVRHALGEVASQIDLLRAVGYGQVVEQAGLYAHQLDAAAARIEALISAGQYDSATTYFVDVATPLSEQARAAVPALAAAIDVLTSDRVATAQRSAAASGTATSIALIIALALAAALAVGAASRLTRPVDRLRLAMAGVAEGTFDAPDDLPYERHDEFGHLFRSFRTMTLRLAELDRMKAEFVGTASHDLKTPISIINGYAELIQEELDPVLQPRHRELLRSLAEQTRTLQRRVDQILEISRMEAGRLQLTLEDVDVRHFAREVHGSFEPAARTRGIRVDLDIHEQTPRFVRADPDVLRVDILGNLLGNALKFTPAGGIIRLTVRADGDNLHLEVADTGVGIPPDQLEHVFEKYYQGRGAAGGAGLGLAIARAAAEAHGGRIEVQSAVGRGTRFRVVLPVRTLSATPVIPIPIAAS